MKTFYRLIGIVILLIFVGCNTEELKQKTQELEAMKNKQKQDSVLLERFTNEMNEINQVLDSVARLDTSLRQTGQIGKEHAIEKINRIDSILQARSLKVEALSKELKNLRSKFSRSLAVGKISEGKSKLELRSNYYKELKNKIKNLETENLNLKDVIYQKDLELVQRDSIIQIINQEREKQKEELEKLQAEIIASAQELADATNATATQYFQLALDLRNIADKTSVLFNKKKKKNLIKMSYDYFQRANELGHPDAEKELIKMNKDKKYAKLLKEKKKK